MTAVQWLFVTCLLLGFGLLVAGVAILAGLGWALVCAALCCIGVSVIVARGMSDEPKEVVPDE